MAATTLNVSAKIQDTTNNFTRDSGNVSVTTADEHFDHNVLTVGTTEESITISTDITGGNGPGFCWMKNKDGTNFVEVGFATTVYPIRLNAGDVALIPLNTAETDIFFKADTAACMVEYYIRER